MPLPWDQLKTPKGLDSAGKQGGKQTKNKEGKIVVVERLDLTGRLRNLRPRGRFSRFLAALGIAAILLSLLLPSVYFGRLGARPEGEVLVFASECSGDWFGADRVVGQPELSPTEPENVFSTENSAYWSGGPGSITCSGFELPDRRVVNASVGLSLAVRSSGAPIQEPETKSPQLSIAIIPSSGPPGTIFSIQGHGFTPLRTVTSHLRWPDGTEFPPLTIETDENGSYAKDIESTGFILGAYKHWAVDDESGTSSSAILLTVTEPEQKEESGKTPEQKKRTLEETGNDLAPPAAPENADTSALRTIFSSFVARAQNPLPEFSEQAQEQAQSPSTQEEGAPPPEGEEYDLPEQEAAAEEETATDAGEETIDESPREEEAISPSGEETKPTVSPEVLDAILQISVFRNGKDRTVVGFVNKMPFSNAINGGYLSFTLPQKFVGDPSSLEITVESVRADGTKIEMFVDSVFLALEVTQPFETHLVPVDDGEKELRDGVFAPGDEARFFFKVRDPQKPLRKALLDNIFDPNTPPANVQLFAEIQDADGNPLPDIDFDSRWKGRGAFGAEEWDVVAKSPQELKPGRYTLLVRFVGPDGTSTDITREFLWGVLAINTAKSIYLPEETVDFAFAVLDEQGNMICDAALKLVIETPWKQFWSLSTDDRTIVVNEECSLKAYTEVSDYEAHWQLPNDPTGQQGIGEYKLSLTASFINKEGNQETHKIEDKFEVRDKIPFDIHRQGPTRIFPTSAYGMKITVVANEAFEGMIVEPVPDSFQILKQSEGDGFLKTVADSQEKGINYVAWEGKFEQGKTYELSYIFDAPDISPTLWMTGPLRLHEKSQTPAAPLQEENIEIVPAELSVNEQQNTEENTETQASENNGKENATAETSTQEPISIAPQASTLGAEYFREVRRWQIAGDAISTRFPTANEIVTTGWTNPDNAHADDGVNYATAAPAKNATIDSRWKTFGFDGVLPSDATITAVKIIYEYKVDTQASIATLNSQATVSGTDCPTTADTDTTEPLTDTVVTKDITSCRSWTRDDLLDANFKVRIGGKRGNSNTAVTFSLDYVKVEVTYETPNFEQYNSRWRNDNGGEGGALTLYYNPTGNGLAMNFSIVAGCSAGSEWDCVDDGSADTSATAPTSDQETSELLLANAKSYFTLVNDVIDPAATITQLDITAGAMDDVGNPNTSVTLGYCITCDGNNDVMGSAQAVTGANQDKTEQFTGLSLSTTDLNNMQLVVQGSGVNAQISTLYVLVSYTTSAASWKAAENTAVTGVNKCSTLPSTQCTSPNENVRVRFTVDNNGASTASNFRLQVSAMSGTCDNTGSGESYVDVPTLTVGCGTEVACLTTSDNFANQTDTTDLADANGVTDPAGSTFVIGRMVEDPGNTSASQTGSLTLAQNNFTEVEYNFQLTSNAADNTDYCFRVSRSGTALTTYTGASASNATAQIKTAGAATFTISGTSDMTSGTVALAVNGTRKTDTGSIAGDGSWSISGVTGITSGNIITVFVDGATDGNESTAVTKYDGVGTVIDGMVLNRNVLAIGSNDNASLTVGDLGLYDFDSGSDSGDEDVMHTANGSPATLDVEGSTNSYTDEGVRVLASNTLTVGGTETLDTHNVIIDGSLTSGGAGTFTVSGSWDNNNDFNTGTETITFTSGSAETIDSTGAVDADVNNVVFNGSGGSWSVNNTALTINADMRVIAGTVQGTQSISIAGGDLDCSGTCGSINMTGGTVTLSGTGNLGTTSLASNWTFDSLTFSGTTTAQGTGTITVNETLTISASQSFNAGAKTYALTDADGCACTPFSIGASATFTAASSMFQYTSTAATNITATTYNILELKPSGAGGPIYTLASGTTATNAGTTLGDGTNAVTVSTANNPTVNISGDLSIAASATLSGAGTGTITVNGGDVTGNGAISLTGGTLVVDGASGTGFGGATAWTFNSLSFTGASSTTTATGAGGIIVSSVLTIGASHTLDSKGKVWTLSGTGTPLVITGILDDSNDSGTFRYTGTDSVTPIIVTASTAYTNLEIYPGASTTHRFGSGTFTLAGSLVLGGNTNPASTAIDLGTNDPSINAARDILICAATCSNQIILTKGSGTITFTGTTPANWTDNNPTTKQDLGKVTVGDGSSKAVLLGSNVVAESVTISSQGGLSLNGSNTLTLTGTGTPLSLSGDNFTESTGTVVYSGNGATNVTATTYYTLNIGTSNSANVVYTALGAIAVNNNLDLQSAASGFTNTFDMSTYDLTVGSTLAGNTGYINVPVRSSFTQSASGTTTVRSSNFASIPVLGGAGTTTFYNLNIGEAASCDSYEFNLAGNLTVSGTLTITAHGCAAIHTLDALGFTITLSGTGTPFVNNDTFLYGTSTVNYTGTSSGVTVLGMTGTGGTNGYHNLGVGTTADATSVAYTLGADTTVNNDLTVGASSGAGIHTLNTSSASSFALTAKTITINSSGGLTANGSTITITGTGTPFSLSGTFTANSSTFRYTGSSAGVTITATTYSTLELKPGGNQTHTFAAGTFTITTLTIGDGTNTTIAATANSPTLNVSGDLTVAAAATLSGAGTGTITINGNVAGTGTINLTGGTFEQRVTSAKNFGTTSGSSPWDFNNLTFSNGNVTSTAVTITTQSASGTMGVAGILRIGKSGDAAGATTTLDAVAAGNRIWTLSGIGGDPFQILADPAGAITNGTMRMQYSGNNPGGDTTIQAANYWRLETNGTETYRLEADTVAANEVTILAGTLDVNGFALTSNGALAVNGTLQGSTDVTVATDVFGTGTINLGGGTFTQRGLSNHSFGSNGGSNDWTFNNLTMSNSSGSSTRTISPPVNATPGDIIVTGTFTLGPSTDTFGTTFDNETANDRVLDIENMTIDADGTLQASSSVAFRVSGNWTNAGTFTANSGTVTFDGTGATSLNSGGTGVGKAFNILSLAKTAAASVTLSTNDLDINDNLSITTANTTLDVSATSCGGSTRSCNINVAGSWSNSGTFTRQTGTVTFDAGAVGKTISDGGSPFYDLAFTGSGGGWTYTDGSATAPNSTSVSNGTVLFVNARYGSNVNLSVTGSGTLTVDHYLGAHTVNATSTVTGDIDTAANDITISEAGSNATVWLHNGTNWGSAAASQTTETVASGTEALDGKITTPGTAGAIRIREFSMTASASCPGAGCALYRYNIQVNQQNNWQYGEYDYYDDYGQNYLTSCWAGSTNACNNDSTDDDTIGASWHRAAPATYNSPYTCQAGTDDPEVNEAPNPCLNEASTNGSQFIGMLTGLAFNLSSTSVTIPQLNAVNNFTDATQTTTATVSTSATNGYRLTLWAAQLLTRVGGSETISMFDDDGTVPNSAPLDWNSNCQSADECGFGYHTNDATLGDGTANRFSAAGCGGDSKCWAGFLTTGEGALVGDSGGPASGAATIVSYKVSVDLTTLAGEYQTTLVYIVTTQY